jgi:hypothetical protein
MRDSSAFSEVSVAVSIGHLLDQIEAVGVLRVVLEGFLCFQRLRAIAYWLDRGGNEMSYV